MSRIRGNENMHEDTIRQVLTEHARLSADASSVGTQDDLYAAGMTSHASVNVMLGLEDAFDIEFPDEMLNRETFATINSITRAVDSLR